MKSVFPGRHRLKVSWVLGVFALVYSSPAWPNWDDAAEIAAGIRQPDIPDREIILSEFGARPDGSTDCLPAITRAIAILSDRGGGRLVVPEGLWFVGGPIHLKSRIELHLSDRAELRFSNNPDDYLPVVRTRWEGTDCYNYSPIIYAAYAHDVAITGTGKIHGNAAEGFGEWRPRQKPAQRRLRQMGNDGFPVHERIFGKGHFLRPSFVQFFACDRVLIEGVTLVESPFWCIHPVYCEDVIVRGVTVNSFRLNNDGVNPDSSVGVLIEDCVFQTGDDAVAIKSGRDQDGWRVGKPTENVVVRNCDMPAVHNGLAVGSEMSGGVRNIFMENCRIGTARSCIYFKSNLDRGGFIRRVRVRQIEVDTAKTALIDFTTDYHGWRGNQFPPSYEDFRIEDVNCRVAEQFGVYIAGKAQAPIREVELRGVRIGQAQVPQYLGYVDGLVFEDVKINGRSMEPKIEQAESLGDYDEERAKRGFSY